MFFHHSIYRNTLTLITVAITSVLLVACGGSDDEDDEVVGVAEAVSQYAGPGSKWDVTLNDDDTFEITRRPSLNEAIDLTVNGTYETLNSGFLLMTVTSASGTDAPSAGDTALALEAPGYAFFLKPLGEGGDQIISMVTAGECPSADINANWVMVKKSSDANANDEGRDFFGTFNFSAGQGAAMLPSRYALSNGFPDQGMQALSGGTCSDGIMEVEDAVMYLTSNGGAIVHTGVQEEDDASFIFAIAQSEISAIANLDGNYAGFLFDDNNANGQKIELVSMSCASGDCTAQLVEDAEAGTLSEESVTITLNGNPDGLGNGLITGTIRNEGTGNLACMADTSVLSTNRKMISCVGQSPGDQTKMFNVLFVSE